jgi:hypothetical protein
MVTFCVPHFDSQLICFLGVLPPVSDLCLESSLPSLLLCCRRNSRLLKLQLDLNFLVSILYPCSSVELLLVLVFSPGSLRCSHYSCVLLTQKFARLVFQVLGGVAHEQEARLESTEHQRD